MSNSVGYFSDLDGRTGRFTLPNATKWERLYFPLFNDAGMMSAVTAQLKGDLKISQNQFLLEPMVTESLLTSDVSRNFWIVPDDETPWSAPGVSAHDQIAHVAGTGCETEMTITPGVAYLSRSHGDIQITIDVTVPANSDRVEILRVTVTNNRNVDFGFSAIPAIPVYARSADNLRDHRQVTTMLSRVLDHPYGILVRPTMSFDERGHQVNTTIYGVLAFDHAGNPPSQKFIRQSDFIGPGGSLLVPKAVFDQVDLSDVTTDGKSVMGAFKFPRQVLAPGESTTFTVVLGITDDVTAPDRWVTTYGSAKRSADIVTQTAQAWQDRLSAIQIRTGNPELDNWMVWVCFQPIARAIYGCSFLPDFGYGRGGRGWRDLWQDCLALLLIAPESATEILASNFGGVRMDGSNATIIGRKPGEFIADRNSIPRTWMDHGIWPVLTTLLYIHQSGDIGFLSRPQTFFKDRQSHRCRQIDEQWGEDMGSVYRDVNGNVVSLPIFNHMLIQVITQFYNVGEHNITRLEGADWNDGLDLAADRGESVAFHCMYVAGLRQLAAIADRMGDGIPVPVEWMQIIVPPTGASSHRKQAQLTAYCDTVSHAISGYYQTLPVSELQAVLLAMADEMSLPLSNEWIKTVDGHEFFNGYYDNDGRAVEGSQSDGSVRMTLPGQVFPILSGIATHEQIESMWQSMTHFLRDPKTGGFHLNTNFGDIQMSLGRAFSFSYGDKENGAYFSHMIVMLMNALYQQGSPDKAAVVFDSIYQMCMNRDQSHIFPSIPEYFDAEGRGAYLYLTGSASWMVVTMVTEIFGVKGNFGDLTIHPRIPKSWFSDGVCELRCHFAGCRLTVRFHNPDRLEPMFYAVRQVLMDGEPVTLPIPRSKLSDKKHAVIEVMVG